MAPFQIEQKQGYIYFALNGEIDAESAKRIEDEIPNLTQTPARPILIDCSKLQNMSHPGTLAFLKLIKAMIPLNKPVRFVNVSESLEEQFRKVKVDKIFHIKCDLDAALVEFGVERPQPLAVEFFQPFITSTLNVLKIQASTEASTGKVFTRIKDEHGHADISGVIGLVSDAFTGTVSISFPKATFLKIMSRMLYEEFTELTQEIQDGAGELTNIIFGQAKVILNEKGFGIKTAIPSVICGDNHQVSNLGKGPSVVIPFETDVGDFFIEIVLSN